MSLRAARLPSRSNFHAARKVRSFAVSSSMLTDGWPDATYRSLSDQKDALAMVESHYAAAGDAKVHKLYVSKQGGGCGTHPNVAGQTVTAGEVATSVKSVLNW